MCSGWHKNYFQSCLLRPSPPVLSTVLGCPLPHLRLKNRNKCSNCKQPSKHRLPWTASHQKLSRLQTEGFKEGLARLIILCSIMNYFRDRNSLSGVQLSLPESSPPQKKLSPSGTIPPHRRLGK